MSSRPGLAKVIAFNVIASILIVGSGLYWYRHRDTPLYKVRQEFLPSAAIFVSDEAMGWRPQPNSRVASQGYYGDERIYDVVYTFNEDGLRISPPEVAGDDKPCVLFFGCSFTFGEGVNDAETMPYRVGIKMHLATRNFGFRGYGPHHMLAAVESGLVRRAAKCHPTDAVYWAMAHHIRRAAGKWAWDQFGPRYVLQPDGSVRRQGSFADDTDRTKLINSSEAGMASVNDAPRTPEDLALFRGIIDGTKRGLEADYPGIRFHVIWWDYDESPEIFSGWAERKILLYRLMDDLPLEGDAPLRYNLPHDVHPNAQTHDAVADFVVRQVIGNH